jgi:hypothetical protein
MKPMIRRLQKLEYSASLQRNERGQTPAQVLRERRRRLAEAEGVPFVDTPGRALTNNQGQPLSVADVLRMGRWGRDDIR